MVGKRVAPRKAGCISEEDRVSAAELARQAHAAIQRTGGLVHLVLSGRSITTHRAHTRNGERMVAEFSGEHVGTYTVQIGYPELVEDIEQTLRNQEYR